MPCLLDSLRYVDKARVNVASHTLGALSPAAVWQIAGHCASDAIAVLIIDGAIHSTVAYDIWLVSSQGREGLGAYIQLFVWGAGLLCGKRGGAAPVLDDRETVQEFTR